MKTSNEDLKPDNDSVSNEQQVPQEHPIATNADRTSEIATELLKLVATLYALRLRNTQDQDPESRAQESNLSSSASGETGTSSPLPSPQTSAESTQQASPDSVARGRSDGPFVRLVTQGRAVLVHMGQLLGILDDQSGFLLHRVVSFDPQRVQLHMMVDLKPRDILELTEPKRNRGVNSLLDHSELGSEETECEKHIDITTVETRASLQTRRSPLLITPGLVLIRVSQVKELAVLPESDTDPASVPGLFNPTIHQRVQPTTTSPTPISDSGTPNHVPNFTVANIQDDKGNSAQESGLNPLDSTIIENEVVAPTTLEPTHCEPAKQSSLAPPPPVPDENAIVAEQSKNETSSAGPSSPVNHRTSRTGQKSDIKEHTSASIRTTGTDKKSRAVSFNSAVQSTPLVANRRPQRQKSASIHPPVTVSVGNKPPARFWYPYQEYIGQNSNRRHCFGPAAFSSNPMWNRGVLRDDPAIVCIYSGPQKVTRRSAPINSLGNQQLHDRPKHRRRKRATVV